MSNQDNNDNIFFDEDLFSYSEEFFSCDSSCSEDSCSEDSFSCDFSWPEEFIQEEFPILCVSSVLKKYKSSKLVHTVPIFSTKNQIFPKIDAKYLPEGQKSVEIDNLEIVLLKKEGPVSAYLVRHENFISVYFYTLEYLGFDDFKICEQILENIKSEAIYTFMKCEDPRLNEGCGSNIVYVSLEFQCDFRCCNGIQLINI
jgi:hypothetical protein